jgi:ketosteroid isomerase-like protein
MLRVKPTACTLVVSLVALTILTSAQPARAQDEASLKAAHDRYLAQWMAGDLTAIDRGLQAAAVGFWADQAAPTDFQGLSAARRQQALKALFTRARDLKITPINVKYRTFQHTGIVWGYYKVESKDSKGSLHTDNWRTTEVFTRDADRWLLASWHLANVPGR